MVYFCDSRDCKAERESVKIIDVLMEQSHSVAMVVFKPASHGQNAISAHVNVSNFQ